MTVKIEDSWRSQVSDEFEKEYFEHLVNFVKEEYRTKTIYPPGSLIFSAFDHCPFDEVKVVIVGQDPYHGPGQANGLCFSVAEGVRHPPSLQNIFKEIADDLGQPIPVSGNLERWAMQGVLLLNATLTVEARKAGSHQKKGWEEFT
ncbi:MAG: uracil-DNA glycosylase, partial [Ekhidna sp.]|nr:uracil-DNA glycosylase [Ekhidna sp.]